LCSECAQSNLFDPL